MAVSLLSIRWTTGSCEMQSPEAQGQPGAQFSHSSYPWPQLPLTLLSPVSHGQCGLWSGNSFPYHHPWFLPSPTDEGMCSTAQLTGPSYLAPRTRLLESTVICAPIIPQDIAGACQGHAHSPKYPLLPTFLTNSHSPFKHWHHHLYKIPRFSPKDAFLL